MGCLGDEPLDDGKLVIGTCCRGDFWNAELSVKQAEEPFFKK